MYIYIYIYIYSIFTHTHNITPLQAERRHSWAPIKPPRGQTLRSPRPKVTSVLSRVNHMRKLPGWLKIAWLKHFSNYIDVAETTLT